MTDHRQLDDEALEAARRDPDWQEGGGFSSPGIGERQTDWPSFGATGPFGTANPSCATCGGRLRGAKKCECETPDWRIRGEKVELAEDAPADGELPEPAWKGDGSALYVGDCVEVMRALPAASVDAVVCDPPYGLEFMGKDWDKLGWDEGDRRQFGHAGEEGENDLKVKKGFATLPRYGSGVQRKAETGGGDRRAIVDADEWGGGESSPYSRSRVRWQHGQNGPSSMEEWHTVWAAEAFRVLKPGGHLLAFGGTRTYHRLACAVEDAGFQIRDMIEWLYGSGFPKSLNVEKAGGGEEWAGWGTALKPGHEPCVLARKPLAGTVAGNVLEHGTGALNIGATRLGEDAGWSYPNGRGGEGWMGKDSLASNLDEPMEAQAGRWPPNVALTHHEECELVGEKVVRNDYNAEGLTESRGYEGGWDSMVPREPVVSKGREVVEDWNCHPDCPVRRLDEQGGNGFDAGGPSRFYYVAKASRSEREAGLEAFELRRFAQSSGGKTDAAGEEADERYAHVDQLGLNKVKLVRNNHPTVKPVELMRWLVRLVTPADGIVLDPFLGSGTTAIAAELEGFRWLGIERDQGYAAIAEGRIRFWREHGEAGLRVVAQREASERARALVAEAGQLDLFEEVK